TSKMKYFIPVFLLFMIACSENKEFTAQDLEAIHSMRQAYTNGWLANDSETVLSLFTNDATIIPSGLAPITGIESIEQYWFPNDTSETIIHSYGIELLELTGTDSIAYSLEKGELSFTYTKGDFSMSKESTSHATTIFKKQPDGSWKIVSRMWTTLNQ
ncbi:MAG: DUF4440 domain-containing protein, partial [Bacteroidota bacterium]